MLRFLREASSRTAVKIAVKELDRLDRKFSHLRIGHDFLEMNCREAVDAVLSAYGKSIDMYSLDEWLSRENHHPEYGRLAFHLQKQFLSFGNDDLNREFLGVAFALCSALGAEPGTDGRNSAIFRALNYCGATQVKASFITAPPCSMDESLSQLCTAAEHGDNIAQSSLGDIYADGRGVPQDDIEAVKWYRMAAEAGNSYAQCKLADMYDYGRGVQQNDIEAMKWFRLAAEGGNADAQCMLGLMLEDSEGLKWLRMAAEQGHIAAMENLAEMYEHGSGVPQNFEEAVRWYRIVAESGEVHAKISLGFMYAEGRGVPQDYIESYAWFNVAAAQGDKHASSLRDEYAMKLPPAELMDGQARARRYFEKYGQQSSDD